ncbi:MAG: efflux RND transporter periplasmic adaptor subunit [Syntrophomonadaceae bacterium]
MKKHRKWPACLVLMALLVSLPLLNGCSKAKEVAQETELTVAVAKAQNQFIARNSRYVGKLRGANEAAVNAKIAGRVTNILVKPGDRVYSGQTLVTLDSTTLQAALKQAEAMVASTRAQMTANQLQLENARLNYERLQQLHEAGAVADNALEAARLQYETLQSGAVEASVASAEAALLSLQDQVNNCNLTAPISGIVGSISVSLGDTATPQTPVAVVSDTSQWQVEVLVSEADINHIQTGSKVDLYITSLGSQPHTATVASVDPVANVIKRSFAVKVVVDNPDPAMRSGMSAEVSIATEKAENTLCVPAEAVIARGDKSVVYTVDEQNRARPLEVSTGIANNHLIQIVQGLEEGTTVITKGNTLVSDGTLVRVISGEGKV